NTTMGVAGESEYSDMNHIISELEFADGIMKRIGCPIIDVSNKAVEETAEIIMKLTKLKNNK
ncbi:MAG: kinase/pyrophosphorylase, partial [Cyclobacteriaceae bacterium]|nr:kinase/pyrophosphorylase [Cyclobacteriaceae bacterium]